MVVLLLLQIRMLLDLGLVEPVDDGVLALGHKYTLDLLVVMKADLTSSHAAVLLEIGPWRVDDGDVVLLVALDGVGLGQLGQVGQEDLRDIVPSVALIQPQVDMCTRQLVYVELGRDEYE